MKKIITVSLLMIALNTPSFAGTDNTNRHAPQKKESGGVVVPKSTAMSFNHRYIKNINSTGIAKMDGKGIGIFTDEKGSVFSVTHVFSDFYHVFVRVRDIKNETWLFQNIEVHLEDGKSKSFLLPDDSYIDISLEK